MDQEEGSGSEEGDGWAESQASRARAAGASWRGTGGEEEGDEEADVGGLGSGGLLLRMQLHAVGEAPGRFWAVHDRGAWGVNVRWLPRAARWLLSGGEEDDAGWLRGDVPSPLLRELLVSERPLLGSCPVSNPLAGTGCVVLQAGGRLAFLRPAPAVAAVGASDGVAAGAAEQAPGSSAAGGMSPEPASALAAIATMSPEALEAWAQVQEFYQDILSGPRPLPPPEPPAEPSTTAKDPAGLAYLADASAWLGARYVQFCHRAHADLAARAQQLQAEVRGHERGLGAGTVRCAWCVYRVCC